ncbi:MAG TPA: hypothetical protein ENI73_00745 [Spirochaetes bacterium]|nr:hypothetical protein [Spirochaetota bacterium]
MLFVIIAVDAHDSIEKRPLYREEHLKRLERLNDEGKLLMAGPFTDTSGSLIIIDAPSLEEAKEFARTDPFYLNGVYASVDVKPFKKVLP